MTTIRRRTLLATAGASLVAGCLNTLGQAGGEGSNTSNEGSSDATKPADGQTEDSALDVVPTTERTLPLPAETEELHEQFTRGAAKDAIPAIDDPTFTDVEGGDSILDPGDPVFGVVRGNDIRAYPQHILVWHEIVNDTLDGDELAVTYCPLTGTAQGFARGDTTFGVSGWLLNSNLVMFDRETGSYWPQMLAVGVAGPYESAELIEFDLVWTTWERWRTEYPTTEVLTEDTGYARDYGRDPYGSYNPPTGHYVEDGLMFPQFQESEEYEFGDKEVFLGLRTAEGALAVRKASLADRVLHEDRLADTPYLYVYDDRLDTAWAYRNPDNEPVEVTDGSVAVNGTVYEPDALPLERVVRYDAFWFAWEGYYPDTKVIA